MSVFRIVFRQDDGLQPSEDVEAVECLQHDSWIVFLDPSGPCRSVRLQDVERVERVHAKPVAPPSPMQPIRSFPPLPASQPVPSYPPIPAPPPAAF